MPCLEEWEERSQMEDGRDRPEKRKGCGDINCYSSSSNQLYQSCNDNEGGYFVDLSTLKVAALARCHMIACDFMYICFYFYNKARTL